MTFSVVIPVFNTEPFLARCLDSLVAQTDGDFEAIIVDDGSPSSEFKSKNGETASEIVAHYDRRFRHVCHEKNRGLFQARQTGLGMAQGDYVVPLDSDDYVLPELIARLRTQLSTPNAQPDVIVYQMAYDDGRKIMRTSVRYRNERLSGADALERFFASKIQCGICGKAVRREVYLKAMAELAAGTDFYLNSSEDLCQTFPVLVNARSVSTLAYPGYRYWLNADSLTGALTDPARLGKAAENTRRVFDVLDGFVRRNGHDVSLCARLESFMRPTLRWYLSCLRSLPEREWRSCVAELNRHFAPDLVAREAMLLLEESKTYRLGRTLVRLCRPF